MRFKAYGHFFVLFLLMLLSSRGILQSENATKSYLALQSRFPGKLITSFGCSTIIQVLGTDDRFFLILFLFSLFIRVMSSYKGRALLPMAFPSDRRNAPAAICKRLGRRWILCISSRFLMKNALDNLCIWQFLRHPPTFSGLDYNSRWM